MTDSHTRACLAHAYICAVENARDSMSDGNFRYALGDGSLLSWADEYLASGLADCRCPAPAPAEDDAPAVPSEPGASAVWTVDDGPAWTPRPCGCPDDYHLADCPIRTGGAGMTAEDHYARLSRPGYDEYYDGYDA